MTPEQLLMLAERIQVAVNAIGDPKSVDLTLYLAASPYEGSLRIPFRVKPTGYERSQLDQIAAYSTIISAILTAFGIIYQVYIGHKPPPDTQDALVLELSSKALDNHYTMASLEELIKTAKLLGTDYVAITVIDEEPMVLAGRTRPKQASLIGSQVKNPRAFPSTVDGQDVVIISPEGPTISLEGVDYRSVVAQFSPRSPTQSTRQTRSGSHNAQADSGAKILLLWGSSESIPAVQSTINIKGKRMSRAVSALSMSEDPPSEYLNVDGVLIVEGVQVFR